MLTDPVWVLPKLPCSSDLPPASCMMQSNADYRYTGGYSHRSRCSLRKKHTCDDRFWKVRSRSRSSLSSVSTSGGRRNHMSSCQHEARSRQRASQYKSLCRSFRSHRPLMENRSSSRSSSCEGCETNCRHYSKARKASRSCKRKWHQPQMTNTSRQNTELYENIRSDKKNRYCSGYERSRSVSRECCVKFVPARVGAMRQSLPVATSRKRSQQYSGSNAQPSDAQFRCTDSHSSKEREASLSCLRQWCRLQMTSRSRQNTGLCQNFGSDKNRNCSGYERSRSLSEERCNNFVPARVGAMHQSSSAPTLRMRSQKYSGSRALSPRVHFRRSNFPVSSLFRVGNMDHFSSRRSTAATPSRTAQQYSGSRALSPYVHFRRSDFPVSSLSRVGNMDHYSSRKSTAATPSKTSQQYSGSHALLPRVHFRRSDFPVSNLSHVGNMNHFSSCRSAAATPSKTSQQYSGSRALLPRVHFRRSDFPVSNLSHVGNMDHFSSHRSAVATPSRTAQQYSGSRALPSPASFSRSHFPFPSVLRPHSSTKPGTPW